jgi:hypothetical protein
VLEVDERVRLPEAIAQFLARDHFSGPREQGGQDLSRLVLKTDATSLPVELTRRRVELERAELNPLRRGLIDGHEMRGV